MPATKPISCAVEQRCIIKFLAKEQVKPIEIYKRLLIQFGDLCLAKSNVYTWIERFKNGRDSVLDDERNHMQPNAVTPQNIIRTEKLIKTNPRISVRDLASDLGISVGSIQNILRKKLKLAKLDDRWVQLEKKERQIKQEEDGEDGMMVDDKEDKTCSNCSLKVSNKKRRKKSSKIPTTSTKTLKTDQSPSLPSSSPSQSSSSSLTTTIITATSEVTTTTIQEKPMQQQLSLANNANDGENVTEKN